MNVSPSAATIATRAGCATHSLYMAFGSRDELLRIVFEHYRPIPDFGNALDTASDDLTPTVQRASSRRWRPHWAVNPG